MHNNMHNMHNNMQSTKQNNAEYAKLQTFGILYTWYMVVQDCLYQYEPVRTLLATWRYENPQNGMY
jgi:hypothetical protein